MTIRSRRVEPRRTIWPFVLVLGGLAVGAVAVGAYLVVDHSGGSNHSSNPPPKPPPTSVDLKAVGAFDPPPGDGSEHNEEIANATDGNPSTYWETEHYASNTFGGLKTGVGLVLDAGSALKLSQLTIASDTPGYHAVIKAGSASHGPFEAVSSQQTGGRSTTFHLGVSSPRRYYLIWITQLAAQVDKADVNEVTGG